MRLHVHEAGGDNGDGERVALLIHGALGAHGTWHGVEAELIARGYRVFAPDLRGHGDSPPGAATAEEIADDLVESLPAGADIAIGHSLGGLALLLAVERLRPARAIYSDPAFAFPPVASAFRKVVAAAVDTATADSLRELNPRWSDADIAAELVGFGSLDRGALDTFARLSGRDLMPTKAAVPSLVQLADPSHLVDGERARQLRERGFEVVVVPNSGHCIHRDDLPGFMASMEGWI